jgi:hypothetical protein
MLWSHDQTLGETTLIATGISNGSAAEYLSKMGSRGLRRLLRDRRWIVLGCDGLDRFLVAERDNALVVKKSDWPTRHEGNVKTSSSQLCEIETPMVQNEKRAHQGFL